MRRSVVAVIAVVAFVAGMVVGILGYVTVTGGSGEPSQDASERAPRLSLDGFGDGETQTPDNTDGEPETSVLPSQMGLQLMADTGGRRVAQAPDASTTTDALNISRGLYRIVQEESQVRFTLQEDLRGVRTDVVGVTDQVGGDLIVNFLSPVESQVGTLVINARTLVTDNIFRNQAIRGQILRSVDDAYEFIEFTPTGFVGLPDEPVTLGEPVTFQIVGDLAIVETTREVTFDASVTVAEAASRLIGSASTVVLWEDFNLSIPSVPGVANITPEVTLAIDFVAELVDAETLDPAVDAAAAEADEPPPMAIPYERGLFRIVQDQSEVRFILQEDLRGVRTDVIGVTNQVGGDLIVNAVDPSQSQVGTLVINARTLQTDNEFRNRAIRSQILRSADDAYEFIEFVPTELIGLPAEPIGMDETISFEIVGDLTIVETTREVTFAVSAMLTDGGDTLTGNADTVVLWQDFNLSIPEVPSVANITPEVTLAIDFVAELVDSQ